MKSSDNQLLESAAQALRNGNTAEAESVLLHRFEMGDTPREICLLLARLASMRGDTQRECRALKQGLSGSYSADDAGLWGRLGTLLSALGDSNAASASFAQATRLQPSAFAAWEGLARALLARQDWSAICAVSESLLSRFPDQAFTQLLLGHRAKAEGERSTASAGYHRALALAPDCGEALYGLIDLDTPAPASPIAARARKLADASGGAAANRINASFAYALVLDKAGNYSRAMRYFQRANDTALLELDRRGKRYRPELWEARLREIRQQYPTPYPSPSAATGNRVPVFIVGLPRSGTTLVEQILSAHPDAQAGGELPFAQEVEHSFRLQRRTGAEATALSIADSPELEAARADYLKALDHRGLGQAAWITDKQPANFQIMGFLRAAFPESPIVHVRRDLRATAFSLYRANFAAHEAYYHSLADLAHFCSYYHRLTQHWRETLPGLIEVNYEALVENPLAEIPRLLEATGIGNYPGSTEPHRHQRPVLTASHSQIRRPIYNDSVDHWRHYEAWLGPLNDLGL